MEKLGFDTLLTIDLLHSLFEPCENRTWALGQDLGVITDNIPSYGDHSQRFPQSETQP